MANSALASTRSATLVPRRKVAAGGLAGALSTILLYVVNTYVLDGNELPADIGAAATAIISFATAWLVPPSRDETTTADPVILPSAADRARS